MKRDCGKGDLIPYEWKLKYLLGDTDKELTRLANGPNDPQFEQIAAMLPPCGNVRLYAYDRQGYANCIRSLFKSGDGNIQQGTDRRHELD
jgi:hypothetical protein